MATRNFLQPYTSGVNYSLPPETPFFSLPNYGQPVSGIQAPSAPVSPYLQQFSGGTEIDGMGVNAYTPRGNADYGSGMGGWDKFLETFKTGMGTSKEPGMIPMGLGAASNLANMFLGIKQYGLMKDAYNTNRDNAKEQFAIAAADKSGALIDRAENRANILAQGKATDEDKQRAIASTLSRYGVKA